MTNTAARLFCVGQRVRWDEEYLPLLDEQQVRSYGPGPFTIVAIQDNLPTIQPLNPFEIDLVAIRPVVPDQRHPQLVTIAVPGGKRTLSGDYFLPTKNP